MNINLIIILKGICTPKSKGSFNEKVKIIE